MARRKKLNTRVAALETNTGEVLIIHGDPTKEEVLGCIQEMNRRYHSGEAGGPGGNPAVRVVAAHFYPTPEDANDLNKAEIIPIPEEYL